jgi:hypothetical protein
MQKRGDLGDEGEFDAIDIKFFVVKNRIHLNNKTYF